MGKMGKVGEEEMEEMEGSREEARCRLFHALGLSLNTECTVGVYACTVLDIRIMKTCSVL